MARSVFDEIGKFEKRLGLPVDFYTDLLEEDDWSFVIKLNALFEGACTHVLVKRLHAPSLADAFSHLDLANSKYGKVKLLRSLGAISSEQASVLRSLAELRNTLVHNISNVGFSFTDHLARKDANQLAQFIKDFGQGLQDTIKVAGKPIPRVQFVGQNPKFSVWLTAADVLACLYLEFEVAKLHLKELGLAEYDALVNAASVVKSRRTTE